MNKKTFTALFILISTLANLLLNFLVIALLAVISCSVLGHVLHVQNGGVYAFTLLACFVTGLLISFIIYTRLSNKIIIKFKMKLQTILHYNLYQQSQYQISGQN
mgnify:CR=1 FL=1